MRLFQHRCRPAHWALLHYRAPQAPRPSIGGTVAKAAICSCGKEVRRGVTANGYQQLGWGASYAEFDRLLDEMIREKRSEIIDAYDALPWWRRVFTRRPDARDPRNPGQRQSP